MSSFRSIAFLALTAGLATVSKAQVSGSGSTTRYWDCCKGSCAWEGKADVSAPITTCDADDNPLSDANAKSGCDGGSAYMCSDQSPWAVSSDLAYGFAAVSIPGGSESSWCCACYELTFTSTSIAGKKMIVQATNTGADLGEGQFDLAIPGGGVGIYNGCTDEWGAPSSGWGAQYGGISTNTCSNFPSALQPGCNFRFGDFFEGADNPSVDYKQVTCPKALTDKTGCIRSGETPTESEADTSDSGSSAPASSSTTAPASSSEAASSSTVAVESSPASSSVVAAAESSSAPASSSTAPVDSSNPPAYSAPASSAPAYSAPAYSAPASSSEAAPVSDSASSSQYMSSPYSFSATYGSASSSAAAPVDTESAAPSGYASGDEECEVQYVYEYV
ncbi:glycoside hydrolase family 45 protein [Hortaea werneckii]|uniref:Cellulase n=1 Tax=Hortaea werneckii TaxID=91943 RepID=A0A3M7GWR8_HORWE|nr:glycoside hydrolase family 45 protein [Hortaea werneckii]KAI6866437.1 glycoside hydrolase family 45 protein [Hortaea werneckii]KAI7246836.1 glycoside hydrolase family 45 protein [Hortaea werneckii]KAI7349044.1 glycoside hydrolase family 45 protein [Hortaea werneckii]KAI7614707.1 glycoside hydrolase family 45 protein [Hortaea werneckii]